MSASATGKTTAKKASAAKGGQAAGEAQEKVTGQAEMQQPDSTPPARPDAPPTDAETQQPDSTPPDAPPTDAKTQQPDSTPPDAPPADAEAQQPDSTSTAPTVDAGGFMLKRELKVTKPLMRGDDVKAIQEALIAKKLHCGVEGANGIYGASTALAVRHFQSMNRLIVSGKVDRFTASALGAIWVG